MPAKGTATGTCYLSVPIAATRTSVATQLLTTRISPVFFGSARVPSSMQTTKEPRLLYRSDGKSKRLAVPRD